MTATRIYVTVNLLTSSTILVGVAAVYAGTGQISYAGLLGAAHHSRLARVGLALIIFAFMTKAAVMPMHGWLARVYPHVPGSVNALFSGLQTKVAIYAIYRLHSVFFDGDPGWAVPIAILLCVSMIGGVLSSLGSSELRAALSLLIVEDAGFVLMGLVLHTHQAISAAFFFMATGVLAKLSLFLVAAAIESVYGRKRLGEVRNLVRRERRLAVVFFLGAMSLAGLPPMAGFVGKLALVTAAFRDHAWVPAGFMLATSLFTLMSVFNLWRRLFMESDDAVDTARLAKPQRFPVRVLWPAVIAVGLVAVLGLVPGPVMDHTSKAADQLLHPVHYVMEAPR